MSELGSLHLAKEPGSTTAITSLMRDLSLGHEGCCMTGPPPSSSSFSSSSFSSTAVYHNTPTTAAATTTALSTTTATSQAPTTAPLNKRQCRSLSFPDEHGGLRSSWRPQGSHLWTTVEKRRCHGGGSVQRGGAGGGRGGHLLSNNKKIGMKRRRTEDTQEQRPSQDLAKMIQKLQTFQSLSWLGFSATDCCQSSLALPTSKTISQLESGQEVAHCDEQEDEDEEEEVDSSNEELDSDWAYCVDSMPASPTDTAGPKCTLWKGEHGTQRDNFQLGGELDLDQIERN